MRLHANAGDDCSHTSVEEGKQPSLIPTIRRIIIINSNRFYRELLQYFLQPLYAAAMITVLSGTADARECLRDSGCDLLISDIVADGDGLLEELPDWSRRAARRTIAIPSHREPAVLLALSEMPIQGVFDIRSEPLPSLAAVVKSILAGGRYWSPALSQILVTECFRHNSVLAMLTRKEWVVLSVIGDGCDDQRAAEQLHMPAGTVKKIRQDIYGKLGVTRSGDLIRRASDLGVVINTEFGVVRPYYQRAVENYVARRSRHSTAPKNA